MTITRPMKGENVVDKMDSIRYPVYVSPKIDGIRSLKIDGKVLSCSFKLIPNNYIRKIMADLVDGLDGEIIVDGAINDVSSAVMSEDGEPKFTYCVFDYIKDDSNLEIAFENRLKDLKELSLPSFCKKVEYKLVESLEELLIFEEECLNKGYEGIMIRSPKSPYKCGKSTVKQGWLLKLKRFKDSEAIITGFYEKMHNDNEEETNELGLTKRSSAKAGKKPTGTLGGMYVKDIYSNKSFKIGGGDGLGKELRQKIWDSRDYYLGKIVKYKYQKDEGYDLPRHPNFLDFRDERDMDWINEGFKELEGTNADIAFKSIEGEDFE